MTRKLEMHERKPKKTMAELIHERSMPVTETGCWLWLAWWDGDDGYGKILIDGRKKQAHRISYETFVGPIPAGLWVLHKCDTPACVNPKHLFLGTCADNNRDRDAKGRSRSTQGQRHPKAKLTNDEVAFIRDVYGRGGGGRHGGVTLKEIADQHDVAISTVSRIVRRDIWGHV